jgi:hypothetical protein
MLGMLAASGIGEEVYNPLWVNLYPFQKAQMTLDGKPLVFLAQSKIVLIADVKLGCRGT